MYDYSRIANLAKIRFLQSASVWIISNKAIEAILYCGAIAIIYYYRWTNIDYHHAAYVVLFLLAYVIIHRKGIKSGFIDGYEQGIIDGTRRKMDYLYKNADSVSVDDVLINEVTADLINNNEKINADELNEIKDSINKGYSKAKGILLNR